MRIIRNLRHYRSSVGTVVTVGNFDGVHRGHRQILARVNNRARMLGVKSSVLTFEPHTQEVLGKGFRCLTTPVEKARLFQEQGIDALVFLKFGKALQRMNAVEFLEKVVFRVIRPREIVFGYDHRFGRERTGDYALLREQCHVHGVRVSRVAPCRFRGSVVSSTRIRELIALGDIRSANGLLGGSYSICGKVVKGYGVGRQVGYPTANLTVPMEKLLMPDGVYAGHALVGKRRYPMLVSLGNRPTFNGKKKALEAHLLGFKGNLYGKEICLEIEEFVRRQKRLKGPEALAEQIKKDITRINKN